MEHRSSANAASNKENLRPLVDRCLENASEGGSTCNQSLGSSVEGLRVLLSLGVLLERGRPVTD